MTASRTPAWWRRRRRGAADVALAQRLAVAMSGKDSSGIRELLSGEIVMIVDGGPDQASGEVVGRDAVASELLAYPAEIDLADINGAPGLVARREGRVVATVCASARRGLIEVVWSVRNPDKLRRWNR